MTNVVAADFPRRMTPQEYERERAELRETYGDKAKEASAKRDQALATLFARSGWTQEELAAKETHITGKRVSQPYISQRLVFGRFLGFIATAINDEWMPRDLTERKFRSYWLHTEGNNERQRFAEVQRLMVADLVLRKEKGAEITTAIAASYSDGKWRPIEKLAEQFEISLEQADDALRRSTKFKMEKRKAGKSFQFRLFPKTRMIGSQELTTKLGPILDGLKAEGRKNTTTMSPPTVAHLAGQLQHLIDEWSK
jgi:hypothetical protein